MDAPSSPSPQLLRSTDCVSTEETNDLEPKIPITVDCFEHSNSTVDNHSPSSKLISNGVKIVKKKTKKKKEVCEDASAIPSSSSCSCSSSMQRGARAAYKRRIQKVRLGVVRRSEGDVEAIALPLGMSFAAVVAQVLERKDAAGERMSVDHLSMICTSAVRESLANVFGYKCDCFVGNFEKSFGSTLRTLRSINEASVNRVSHLHHLNTERSTSNVTRNKAGGCTSNFGIKDCQSEIYLPATPEVQENTSTDSLNQELILHGQIDQLACVSTSTLGSVVNQLSTIERSVMEQARSNDLKTLELGLTMKKLRLKETQVALNYDSNNLERSKASFKAAKFKNQLEETKHAELLKKCIDCLVTGLVVMSVSLLYGAYVYSYKRITEATASCTPEPQESKSWWIPKQMASFNSGLHIIKCQVQVVSRMLFGVLMILAIAFLLLQRSAAPKQTMPVTFILTLLGIVCGVLGKLCVDTLGGSGYYWLLYWETLCLLHFFSNVFTSALFYILHEPVNVSQRMKCNAVIPYWIRRFLFYAIVLLFLPLFCGLMPFASLGDWKDHFLLLVTDFMSNKVD